MNIRRLGMALGVGVLVAAVSALADEGFTKFKLIEATGIVKIKADDKAEYQKAEAGKEYACGVTILTARRSVAVVEFTPENVVRVLASSEVKVIGKTGQNAARVKLVGGDVEGRLKKLPKDMKFEVETPAGICGATGTEFSVGYGKLPDGQTREMVMDCREGQLVLDGDFVKTQEDTLRAGSTFRFTVIQCPDRSFAFLPDIEIAGQDLNVAFGQKNVALLGQGSWSQAAMPNVPGKTPFVAVRVLSGQMLVSGFAMTDQLPAGFIRDRTLIYVEERQAGNGFYRDLPPGALIDGYSGSRLTVGGSTYDTDVIIYPERILAGFWFGRGNRVYEDDLKAILDYRPDTLILGTGPAGLKSPPEKLIADIKARGVEVFVLPTAKAVELFNEMKRQQPKAKLVAALNIEDYRNAEEYMKKAEELCRKCAALGNCGNCCQFFRGYAGELVDPVAPTAPPAPPPSPTPTPPTPPTPPKIPDVPQSPGEL